MLADKNKRVAIVGTILFHLGLIVVLIFSGLKPPEPPRPVIGMSVNLGNSDDGMGEKQPDKPKEVTQSPPPKATTSKKQDQVVTQDQVKTVQASDQKKQTTKQQPKTKPVEEPKINQRAVYKKKNTTNGGSEGQTGKPGDQGKEDGTKGAKNYVGIGGDGVTFSLVGRKKKSLPKPEYNSEEQGTVIVKIWVNKSGKVINAEVLYKGTTTADANLHRVAITAAKQALFDENPNAAEVQTGTITYDFILLN